MLYDRIAVVDDNPKTLDAIKVLLEKNYDLVMFSSGEELLSYLKAQNRLSLIILDVYLKGTDGLTTLSEIRKNDKKVPIIIMTAFGTKELIIQALQNHADDFIEKPFDIKEFQTKVKNLLQGNQPPLVDKGKSIERIKYFVEKNCTDVDLEAMASEMCLSKKYISRLFKEKHNINFREYKLRVRIEKAKEMLRNSSLNVDQISLLLGYQNTESFLRVFKRRTSLTPSQYRRQVQFK
ncbi:MAG: response regulator [Candidatus Omnitrophota bacterium]